MRSESLRLAQKKYYEKMKHDEHFKSKRNEAVKRYYLKNRDTDEFKEKANAKAKEYYERNKEAILERRKEKYRMNKSTLESGDKPYNEGKHDIE